MGLAVLAAGPWPTASGRREAGTAGSLGATRPQLPSTPPVGPGWHPHPHPVHPHLPALQPQQEWESLFKMTTGLRPARWTLRMPAPQIPCLALGQWPDGRYSDPGGCQPGPASGPHCLGPNLSLPLSDSCSEHYRRTRPGVPGRSRGTQGGQAHSNHHT